MRITLIEVLIIINIIAIAAVYAVQYYQASPVVENQISNQHTILQAR